MSEVGNCVAGSRSTREERSCVYPHSSGPEHSAHTADALRNTGHKYRKHDTVMRNNIDVRRRKQHEE